MNSLTGETLLLVNGAVCLAALLGFRALGLQNYPLIVMTACMAIIALFGSKLISVFGWTTNIGNVLYAMTMLCQAVTAECAGKEQARRNLTSTTFGLCLLFVLLEIVSARDPVVQSAGLGGAIDVIAGGAANSFPAAIAAFTVAQFVFLLLLERFGNFPLWCRYLAAVTAAQIVDSAIFFTVLFGLIGVALGWEIMLTGFLIKVAFAIVTVPALLWIAAKDGRNSTNQRG